jgi:hypothetical protein
MKNAVFWDVAPCRYCVNRRFGGTYCLLLQGISEEPVWAGGWAHAGSSFANFSTLNMEAIRSSETSVYTISAWRHIPEDGILHQKSHCRLMWPEFELYTSQIQTGSSAAVLTCCVHRSVSLVPVQCAKVKQCKDARYQQQLALDVFAVHPRQLLRQLSKACRLNFSLQALSSEFWFYITTSKCAYNVWIKYKCWEV